ncbi:uncharacterized protein LOC122360496 isoform X3 [Puntigrus tetrazona]|uniref:uncharacterized protein LOC122360496 isoform X3 n=1 Tax=Puntigrus tetrazona TaxID=1606681 RepID=UPI001C894CDF|nr:uncharacterized protein LOC122360496 isoform X3 [Puntigrus tetrazona]XP_043117086.1 uncharacterized protein LOC122360496 isoform X3 [Puntigrus tetrazona]
MKAILTLLACMAVVYEGALCQSIRSDFVLLNQPYPFPGNASGCRQAEWRKTNPTANIATYQNQACTTSEGLEEEYRCEDNHLLLKSAKFNDAGSYEFICNWDIISIRLDVLYAQDVSAVETENIILNCYAHSTEDVTWLHNKKIILHVKMNGSASFSKDYEGRVSVKKSCFKTGDFSLTIARVLKEDAGTYRCFVDDETKKGIPQASVLHVNDPDLQSERVTLKPAVICCLISAQEHPSVKVSPLRRAAPQEIRLLQPSLSQLIKIKGTVDPNMKTTAQFLTASKQSAQDGVVELRRHTSNTCCVQIYNILYNVIF